MHSVEQPRDVIVVNPQSVSPLRYILLVCCGVLRYTS